MLEPAHTIITICGGVTRTAELSERDKSSVSRWRKPVSEGGTDGRVPGVVQPVLLRNAKAAGIDLRAEHFFAEPGPSPKDEAAA